MVERNGQQLGNYRLIQRLGGGRVAEVYLGEHMFLNTLAAIKIFQVHLLEQDTPAYLREAHTIAGLIHPNIVRVLDFGVQDETFFLVMEYAPGDTLRQNYPPGSRLSPASVALLVNQIANALQYAHDQNIIHGNLKPENILLGEDNEVLVSDFGISTVLQTMNPQQVQPIAGTIAYIAPEQFDDKPQQASDQYALAVIAYEWLNGERPFQDTIAEISSQYLHVQAAHLSGKVPGISPEVDKVVMMALAKDPRQRFQSIQAFAQAFEQACQLDSPTSITSPPGSHSLVPSIAQPSGQTPQISGPGTSPAPWSDPISQVPVVALRPDQQTKRGISRRAMFLGLTGLVVAGGGVLVWSMLSRGSSPSATHPTPTASTNLTPTVSATPSPTATLSPTPTSTSPPSPQGTTYLVYPGQSQMYTVSWSLQGSLMTSAGLGPNVEVWSVSNGKNLFSYNGGSNKVYSVAWSPDGTRIASGHSDGTVQVWDVSSQRRIFSQPGHTSNVNAVAWSPNGNSIVSASGDKTVKVWDAATGTLLTTFLGHSHYVNAVAWSHDGSRIVSGSGDATAQVWNAASGNTFVTYTGHSSDILGLAWSLDDTRIASASKDTTAKVWDSSNGNTFLTYTGHAGYVNALAWSPNGFSIATGSVDRTVQVWGAATGSPLVTYRAHADQVQSVAWSPDSTKIASASNDGTVRVWQAM